MSIPSHIPPDYRGKPFHDDHYTAGPQLIPGRLHCAFYDLGGPEVAFHDLDPINRGSGELNQKPDHQRPHASPYHWNFRRHEALDTSYTKESVDFPHPPKPGLVNPPPNQLYIGWTTDGEWANYTIHVKTPGKYRISALYAHKAQPISFSLNRRPATTCHLPSDTGDWHRWNYAPIGTIDFPTPGLHLLTFHYNSGNNFAYFDFEPVP